MNLFSDYRNLLRTTVACIFLTGCGGEDAFNVGGCNAANTPTNITAFSLAGSTTVSGVEVVNDSADFSLGWTLTSSCTYTYELYLAIANTQNVGIDIQLDTGTCGHGLSCAYDVDVFCSFDATAKTMSCNGGSSVDVASLLPDPGPSVNRYFILVAHNEMADDDVAVTARARIDF